MIVVTKPSHGYRAVHVIAPVFDRRVEIEIRTREQHLWAELSEKLSDVYDPNIKYGGGPEWVRENLMKYSALTARIEAFDRRDADSAAQLASLETAEETAINRGQNKDELAGEIVKMKLMQLDQERITQELKELLADVLIEQYNNVRREHP